MTIEQSLITKAAEAHAVEVVKTTGKTDVLAIISDYAAGMNAGIALKTSLAGYGSYLIELERLDHLKRGYDPNYDDNQGNGELAMAAALYAADETDLLETKEMPWPWPEERYPDRRGQLDRKRQLVIAGALIAAEIDRLLRIEERATATL